MPIMNINIRIPAKRWLRAVGKNNSLSVAHVMVALSKLKSWCRYSGIYESGNQIGESYSITLV